MKRYYSLILGTVAFFLIIPLFFGIVAKKRCYNLVELVNSSANLCNIKLMHYKHGWFRSKATFLVRLEQPDLKGRVPDFEVTAKIQHGPFTINWTRFYFMQAAIQAAAVPVVELGTLASRFQAGLPHIAIQVLFKLNGWAEIKVVLPKFRYQDDEQGNYLAMAGLNAKIHFRHGYRKLRTDVEFFGLESEFDRHQFSLGKLQYHYAGVKTGEVWCGNHILQLASAYSRNSNGHTIKLDDLLLKKEVTCENGKTILDYQATLNQLNINTISYAANALAIRVDNLARRQSPDGPQLTLRSFIASPTLSLLETILAVLNRGGNIEVREASSDTYWGKMLFSAKINGMRTEGEGQQAGWLATLIGSKLELDLKTERAFALYFLEKFYKSLHKSQERMTPEQQAQKTLDSLIQEGKIFPTNLGLLQMRLSYQDAELAINNRPLTISIH